MGKASGVEVHEGERNLLNQPSERGLTWGRLLGFGRRARNQARVVGGASAARRLAVVWGAVGSAGGKSEGKLP